MFIKTIAPDEATGKIKTLYDRVTGPDGNVDNILMSHSLRPHTLEGHMALYKATLHHYGNALDKAFLETLGVYVSMLNGCHYCYMHHFEGLKRHLKDDAKAERIWDVLKSDNPDGADDGTLDARTKAACRYARKLTVTPADMAESDVKALRDAGLDDGEILEINQVVAYFSYANRTVLGLGVSTEGDILGLSPNKSDDPDNWGHG